MVFDKAKAEINPLARTTGKNAPLGPLGAGAPLQKNVGADIESAPTDFVFNIGLAGSGRYNKKRVCDILDVTDSWCAVQDSNL